MWCNNIVFLSRTTYKRGLSWPIDAQYTFCCTPSPREFDDFNFDADVGAVAVRGAREAAGRAAHPLRVSVRNQHIIVLLRRRSSHAARGERERQPARAAAQRERTRLDARALTLCISKLFQLSDDQLIN